MACALALERLVSIVFFENVFSMGWFSVYCLKYFVGYSVFCNMSISRIIILYINTLDTQGY